ncbi:hypothetical protein [Amycolatopsis pithecellobii]|nr:hypothetical protein [Amycolatopsis pithecellobii]
MRHSYAPTCAASASVAAPTGMEQLIASVPQVSARRRVQIGQ